jgi:hypothetical protein
MKANLFAKLLLCILPVLQGLLTFGVEAISLTGTSGIVSILSGTRDLVDLKLEIALPIFKRIPFFF